MEQYHVRQIGVIRADGQGMRIVLDQRYTPALDGLEGFSHINVLWWFSGCDTDEDRSVLQEKSPYRNGPDTLGTFATRSPQRPNPIALSCTAITYIDRDNAVIGVAYLDAEDGSPVLDIKPYTPSLDRVACAQTPGWCSHWPKDLESSEDFDWANEFQF